MLKEEIEMLISLHRAALFTFAFKRMRQAEDAEDAVGRAIIIALQNIAQYKGPGAGAGGTSAMMCWVFGILNNVCKQDDKTRQKYVSMESFDDYGEIVAEDGKDWIGAELAHEAKYRLKHIDISEAHRDIVLMRLHGHSRKEIAEATGRQENTIKIILQRVFARLKASPFTPAPDLAEAGYIFKIGSEATVYRAPTKTGSALANEKLRRLK